MTYFLIWACATMPDVSIFCVFHTSLCSPLHIPPVALTLKVYPCLGFYRLVIIGFHQLVDCIVFILSFTDWSECSCFNGAVNFSSSVVTLGRMIGLSQKLGGPIKIFNGIGITSRRTPYCKCIRMYCANLKRERIQSIPEMELKIYLAKALDGQIILLLLTQSYSCMQGIAPALPGFMNGNRCNPSSYAIQSKCNLSVFPFCKYCTNSCTLKQYSSHMIPEVLRLAKYATLFSHSTV